MVPVGMCVPSAKVIGTMTLRMNETETERQLPFLRYPTEGRYER